MFYIHYYNQGSSPVSPDEQAVDQDKLHTTGYTTAERGNVLHLCDMREIPVPVSSSQMLNPI